jgi:hypothetical protein
MRQASWDKAGGWTPGKTPPLCRGGARSNSPAASGPPWENIGKKANTKPAQKIPLELRAKTR